MNLARREAEAGRRSCRAAPLVWKKISAVTAMPRTRLPDRRAAETSDLEFAGLRYVVTIGRFSDGRPAETFVCNHLRGNAVDVIVRDAGILISLLLQHGCAAETIAHSISRNSDGSPAGVIGAVLDLITRRDRL